jgi:hypothetical protein
MPNEGETVKNVLFAFAYYYFYFMSKVKAIYAAKSAI